MNATKTTLKWIGIIGLYLLLIIPFLYSKEFYFPYITMKAFAFRAIVEVIFGAWVGLAVLDPRYRPKKSPLLWGFLSLLVVMLVANLLGIDVAKSIWSNYERMDGYITLLHVFALFIVAGSLFTTPKRWWWFWHTSIVLSLGHAAVAILQYTGELSASFSQDRVDAFFGNAIYLAVFMLFHVFIALFYLLKREYKNVYAPYLYTLAIVLQILTIILTATRGTLIGLAGGLGLTFLIIALFSKQQKNLRAISGGALIVLVVLAGIIFGAKESSFVQGIPAFKRLASISVTDNTTNARLINWGIAWNASQEKPLLGYGQGNYGEVYDLNYNPQLWNQEQWFDRSHNVLLDWLFAGGWLGLLAYLSLFAGAVYLVLKKNSKYSLIEKSVFIGLLAGYFVHNIFVFDNLTSYMMFAFVLAFIHSQNGSTLFSEKVMQRKSEVPVTIALVALLGGFALVPLVNAKAFEQNTLLISNLSGKADTVEQLLENFKAGAEINSYGQTEYRQQMISFTVNHILPSNTISDETKQAYVDLVVAESYKELEEHPTSARSHFVIAQFFAQIGAYEEAKTVIEKAIELSPKKQLLRYIHIEILLRLGDTERAFTAVKENYDLNPDNTDAWAQYVRLLTRLGNEEEANALIEASYKEDEGRNIISLLNLEIRRSPNNPQAYASLGTAYVRVGRIDDAIAIFKTLAETIPEAKEQAEATVLQLETTGTLE